MNESKDIRLEVENRFYLSPIVRADKAAYLEHFADPEIAHNLLAIPFPYTETDADWWLDRCEQSVGSPITNFALRAPSGYLIGAIGFVGALSPDAHSAEFGYWLAQPYRGHGLMPRVIRTFSGYAFQQLRIHRLFAAPFSSNLASHRALEKAGVSTRRATQTSPPQARHIPRCNYLWTHFWLHRKRLTKRDAANRAFVYPFHPACTTRVLGRGR
jgi:ribosomal-protein-alanine N-acetyltransferase